MDQSTEWGPVQSDWYSPTRLHGSPVQYDFPGDRFIPNRSLMDLDQARTLLTIRGKEGYNPNFTESYRQKLQDNLALDSEGKPFRMLVFRGSPKSTRKSIRLIDEMRKSEEEGFNTFIKQSQARCLPKRESRILDAPKLRNDFYLNVVDWGKNNVLAVALGSELFLWNSESSSVHKLLQAGNRNDYPTSVAWSVDARILAVGYMQSKLELWDVETSKLTSTLDGHKHKVTALTWNDRALTSGGQDKDIINHDVRAANNVTSCLKAHSEEICGLKWSSGGNLLASGGNENLIHIWEASQMSSSKFLHRFSGHRAAVKALAWCPYQFNVLASGGGSNDGCIKMWNTQNGTCIESINTKSQICGLEWNRHHKEILSGHGYTENQLCLWRYPSMTKVGEIKRHLSRVLHLSQSPDGLTTVSAGADETLRFWEIFGPPHAESPSDLEGHLSLKTFPLR
ncbi:cell division cycle 20.5 cofactor of APC complex-like isoform X1 [Tripterygium wilfordii]|uniref:Cell division cycle 20.5 cofactor of APC complex-like isoform X1 n=1 Tax=Tripterygium wilfordii TaxID=458696 RepID=A0A7J7CDT0_TRIWF|nr:cell division cycle 20.5, cofactor of APC complex-like [Tripterygium wilfordii]KAF5732262.1 cell division cycle 20.5 cofactor of APC complex-like isoform X1 [Tripterygium wilfordii]